MTVHKVCTKSLKGIGSSTRSPRRQMRDKKTAGNQKKPENPRESDEMINAPNIPMLPPFGTFLTWELRLVGLSIILSLCPYRDRAQAPRPPNRIGPRTYLKNTVNSITVLFCTFIFQIPLNGFPDTFIYRHSGLPSKVLADLF